MMGPTIVRYALANTQDPALWETAAKETEARDFDQKACGREELGTMNLWAGIDAPAAV